MQYLLHIDTSGDTGLVAIGYNGALLDSRVNEETRNHASSINTMIDSLLGDNRISFEQISAIAVCAGPGSYTGLRIGMATAKGLCYALDRPLILDNKLTLLALDAIKEHPGYTQYLSLIIAREREYFISIYDKNGNCILVPQHVGEEELNTLINRKETAYFITNTEKKFIDNLMISDFKVDIEIKTPLKSWIFDAFGKYNCNQFVNLMEAEPFYLKQVYTHK